MRAVLKGPYEDAVVVGGGLAGAAVALELARGGLRPVLLERTRAAQHKVCGEFFSGEAVHYLGRYGVDLSSLGAVALRSVRLSVGSFLHEEELPFPAFSVTRCLLDEEMLRRAAVAGVEVRRGCQVEGLEQEEGVWSVAVRDGDAVRARDLFLATGKHDLRGRPRPGGLQGGLVAFKMYCRLRPEQHAALGDAVELVLFPGGYAGLQPVEDGRVNLCLLVTLQRLRRVGSNWKGLLASLLAHVPHLCVRLEGAEYLLDAPLTASQIPYGHLQEDAEDGLWRVGDQAAVIPSFCGDGMSIALHSGVMAARHLMEGGRAEGYQRELRAQLRYRLKLATRLSQLLVAYPAVAQVTRVMPGLMSQIASLTRIPAGCLV